MDLPLPHIFSSPRISLLLPQVFGLFVHFCLTTLGLPSPLAILASLPFAGTKPQLS